MEFVKIGQLKFEELHVKAAELHKIRGWFGCKFTKLDALHNHREGNNNFYYRYPSVQFKKIDNHMEVHGYGDSGVAVLKELFLDSEQISIDGSLHTLHNRELDVNSVEYGESTESFVYSFTTPWLALNQENHAKYLKYDDMERKEMLASILINNIIAFCKFTGYTVKNRLSVKADFKEVKVNLKGESMTAFMGDFMVGFLLPDYLGLGKSSSRGYGNVKRKF